MRWAKKEHITDNILKNGIDEIDKGLIDVDLGSGLVKKRVSRKGEGKRGGHRVLLAFKEKDRSIFIFGFCLCAVYFYIIFHFSKSRILYLMRHLVP